MNKESNPRIESIHLYNPKEEGWISYDINYTNALRKIRKINDETQKTKISRYAA